MTFALLADNAEAARSHDRYPPALAHKVGALATGVSAAHEAKPPAVIHHETIHNPQPRLTPAQWADEQVSPAEFRAWKKVNICEESGNWHVRSSDSDPGGYSGGLGISNYNWDYYRPDSFPENAADATPDEQIVVAQRIQPNPPDQNGCSGAGW